MRSLGIDLAAEPPNTAACEITWTAQRAHARLYADRLDDGRLLTLIETADKVGIDCPFGWPLPGRGQLGSSHRQSLRYRLTDKVVHQQVGIWPLSVSTDRIGVTAMRCAALLDALAAAGHPVDRAGGGRVVEVYPAAALKHWGLPHQGYKKQEGAIVRAQALDRLRAKLPMLILDGDALDRCQRSDDAFDALICALVAAAA
jgi:predicted RNase H-like nuclease